MLIAPLGGNPQGRSFKDVRTRDGDQEPVVAPTRQIPRRSGSRSASAGFLLRDWVEPVSNSTGGTGLFLGGLRRAFLERAVQIYRPTDTSETRGEDCLVRGCPCPQFLLRR